MSDPKTEPQDADIRRDSATVEKGKLFKHDIDADEAMKAVTSGADNIVIDEETNRRLLRKIDLNLMPVGLIMGTGLRQKLICLPAYVHSLRSQLFGQ
jgi:ACS family allantoate permease-like MFS transporter